MGQEKGSICPQGWDHGAPSPAGATILSLREPPKRASLVSSVVFQPCPMQPRECPRRRGGGEDHRQTARKPPATRALFRPQHLCVSQKLCKKEKQRPVTEGQQL